MFIPNREELAWSGGFFCGEGSTTVQSRKTENKSPRPILSIQHNIREELDRFQIAVNLGKVYGPYSRPKKTVNDFYHYTVAGYKNVQAIVAMLWPWLSSAKQNQAIKALEVTR